MIPAVANAVYDAVGVRIDETPITPDKVIRGARAQAPGQEPRASDPTGCRLFTFPEPRAVESAFGLPAEAIAERPFSVMMRLPAFRYLGRRSRWPTRAQLMAEHGPEAMLVAGGTDLYPEHEAAAVRADGARRAARRPRAASA